MLAKIQPYWKAVVAFITPGAVFIGSAVLESSHGGDTITQAEWITAAVACVVTAGAVWRVENVDNVPATTDEPAE